MPMKKPTNHIKQIISYFLPMKHLVNEINSMPKVTYSYFGSSYELRNKRSFSCLFFILFGGSRELSHEN